MEEPTIQLDSSDIIEDVNDEAVEQETTTTESSPEETKDAETEETSEEGDAESDTTEDSEPEDTPEPLSPAENRKEQLNGEIRDLVATRNALKAEVEQVNQQVYAPQTAEQLIEEGYTPSDARIAAMEQRLELQDYNNRIAESQLTISHESEKVLSDFTIFNPDSPDFKPQVAQEAAAVLNANLIRDPNTQQIIGSNISPYQLYKTINTAYQASATENKIAGQRAAEEMSAHADEPSSAVPKQSKEDPFLTGLLGGKY